MYAIFSIDGEADPMIRNQFVGWFNGHELRKDNLVPCVGVYKGQAEHSFIVSPEDFDAIVKGSHWIKGQESFLRVALGNKMECHLEFQDGREEVPLGHMCPVSKVEAEANGDYTYLPESRAYYIAADRNPDGYSDEDEMGGDE